jgi:RND superfamily putative drug exporter
VLAALLGVLVAIPFAAGVFDRVEPFDISDPESEFERADAAYAAVTGQSAEPDVLLLLDSAGRGASEVAAGRLESIEGIASTSTPEQQPKLRSDDGETALVEGFLAPRQDRVEAGERVEDEFASDPDVLVGGTAVAAAQIGERTERDTRRIELFAAPVLLLLLLFVFRSPVAAALPLVLAGVSIVFTLALLSAMADVVDIDLFSLQVVTGLGVGLAIDYSLFVVARYRAEVSDGEGAEAAHHRTVTTAGRTVAYGAMTVATAMAALIIFPQQFLSSTGIAGALVALLSGASALVVLPALLKLLGPRVAPGQGTEGERRSDPLSGGSGFWAGLSRRVMAYPLPVATFALLLMLAVGSPALGGKLTTPDARVVPGDQSARMVDEAVRARFEGGTASRMQVVIPATGEREASRPARTQVEDLEGVESVQRPERLPDGGSRVVVTAGADPLSDAAQALLDEVRAAPWPPGTLIGGRAAELSDQRSSISDNAPQVVAVVVVTNLLLVLAMVRSLLLPLISLALNALTVLASYGIMVALFEHRTTAELLGANVQDGIDVSVPILAFAVVFGLSTDYGIFLFSRISEARETADSEPAAITEGLALTGRLITSAAVIFSVAIGVNVFSGLVIVKEFAVAVAIAVLLDATVVRGLLVPAVLKMLGARAWWPGAGGTTQ